jgi:hypothetical protein
MRSTEEGSPGSEHLVVPSSVDGISESCRAPRETAAGGYSVRVATDIGAVETLRPLWKIWANSLDTDLDFYLHQLNQDSTALAPYVITVYSDGIARAMLVGQIRKQKASAVISFVNIPGPTMRVLEIKKGGRMGQDSQEIDRMLAMALFKATQSGAIDSIFFERLPLDCELFRQIRQIPAFFLKERVPHIFCYSVLPFSNPVKEQTQVFSGKMLREMRRKTRIVENAFPGQVSLKCFSQPGELEAGLCDATRVAVTTWQYSLGQGFSDTSQTLETLRYFASRGWLRIYVLYIREVPCAFLIGEIYNHNFYCQYAGYHPEYTRYSVGSLLTARVFEQLAAAGVQRVDLGEGGQEHNRRIGCQMVREGTVHVYSPTLRGIWLSVFFGTTQIVRTGGRRVRSTFRLNGLGRVWRQYLLSRRKFRRQSSYVPSARKSI